MDVDTTKKESMRSQKPSKKDDLLRSLRPLRPGTGRVVSRKIAGIRLLALKTVARKANARHNQGRRRVSEACGMRSLENPVKCYQRPHITERRQKTKE
jgi:hypothetical protein